MRVKAIMPRDKLANLKFNERTLRWDYRVRLIRPDGSRFSRAGSAATEPEAREKRNSAYREFNADLGQGRDEQKQQRKVGPDNLRAWTERVLPILEDNCAPTTFEAYRHSLENHVLPALGSLALEQLRTLAIAEHLQKLCKDHSPGVASQARSALSRVLQIAHLDGRIATNPVKGVRVGMRERKLGRIVRAGGGDPGKRWLTMREGQALLKKVAGTPAYMPILLGLRFGLRSGESLGLEWGDVEPDSGVLKVRQQAQYLKGTRRHIAPPKSAAGIRNIPIPKDLVQELAEAKLRAVAAGQAWVCVSEDGAPLHPKHVTRLIKTAVIGAGFDGSDGLPVPTSHDFRSSYLTWLANYANNGLGVKPHILMAIAGHGDIDTVMRFYIHAGIEDVAEAVNSLTFSGQTFIGTPQVLQVPSAPRMPRKV